MEDFYHTPADNAKRFAELAQQSRRGRYTAFKSMAVPSTMPVEGQKPVRSRPPPVAAMRDAVGPDIDIMVDCHARPSPAMELKFGKALDDFGLLLRGTLLARVRRRTRPHQRGDHHARASGERVTHLEAFKDLFEKRAVEICQLDITHCGGLSAARRIAALAEAHRIALAPHNPQGPVSTAASLEFGFLPAELPDLREPSTTTCPGDRTSSRRDSRSRRPYASCVRTPPRPRDHDQRGRSEKAPFPAGGPSP